MMNWYKSSLELPTRGKGLYPFTEKINARIRHWAIREGMCYLYLQHTSASMLISENYDPTAKTDLENFMKKLVPEGEAWYRHTLEGPDDTTSHIRAMLTQTSMTIPIDDGRLSLGTWQGVYLFEHRARPQSRTVLIRCLGVSE